MKKRFTDEDIIRFLYDEMNQEESETFLTALVSDEELWHRYEILEGTIDRLSEVSFEPSDDSVAAVQAFVRASNPEQPLNGPMLASENHAINPNKTLSLGKVSINLQAVVGVALGIFLMISVAGSAYKVSREKFANPNTGKLVENQYVAPEPAATDAPKFDWEMKEIDQELEKVKEGLEILQDKSLM
jgi:hypothetical protein